MTKTYYAGRHNTILDAILVSGFFFRGVFFRVVVKMLVVTSPNVA
jgi:hypothetical protein